MKQPVCELCGSTDFSKEEGVFVCQSCGTKYSPEDAKNLMKEVPESSFASFGNALKDAAAPSAPESPLAQFGSALKDTTASSLDSFASGAANSFGAITGSEGSPLDALKNDDSTPLEVFKNASRTPLDSLMNSQKQETGGAFDALGGIGAMVADAIKAEAFDPMTFASQANDPQLINDYVCRGWSKALDAYKDIEHPDQEEQQKLVATAKNCLAALNSATTFDSGNCAQTAVLYDNCRQIVRAAKNTNCYTQNDDSAWKRNSLPLSTDFKVVGQSESWDKVYEKCEAVLEQEYYVVNPAELEARTQLATQEAQLALELDELKTEKKSHGFFDFSGKREVKERMAPLKDQLGNVRSQINAISRRAKDFAELKIDEYARANSFMRLS